MCMLICTEMKRRTAVRIYGALSRSRYKYKVILYENILPPPKCNSNQTLYI